MQDITLIIWFVSINTNDSHASLRNSKPLLEISDDLIAKLMETNPCDDGLNLELL